MAARKARGAGRAAGKKAIWVRGPRRRKVGGGFEPEELCPKLLKFAMAQRGVGEAEAYVSKNRMTQARVETLRHGRRQIGPNAQQALVLENMEACVRVVVKGAVGTAATLYLDDESLRRTAAEARKAAAMMAPDPNFRSLAKPPKGGYLKLPADRKIISGDVSEALMGQVEAAAGCFPQGLDLAGSIIAISEVFSVRNSNGICVERGEDSFAVAQLTGEKVDGGEVISSGMGWSASRWLDKLDARAAARKALELATLTPKLKSVPEGDYDVLLGPYAVADVIDNMLFSQIGLGSIYSGTSWLPAERRQNEKGTQLRWPGLGEMIADERITLREEPHLRDGMGSKTADDEGVPTQPRNLIENGVWKGVFANSYYAHLYGMEPPGNGFRHGSRPGRIASAPISSSSTNLLLTPGDMKLDELVKECRGSALYVPRTWYTYPTRYGASGFSSSNRSTAFLIENGEMTPIAPNAFKLRGDASRVLKEVKCIGKETVAATTWSASFCSFVPHILTGGIRVEKPAGD